MECADLLSHGLFSLKTSGENQMQTEQKTKENHCHTLPCLSSVKSLNKKRCASGESVRNSLDNENNVIIIFSCLMCTSPCLSSVLK